MEQSKRWWLGKCPAWCTDGHHEVQEHPEDRVHRHWEFVAVELTTADLVCVGKNNAGQWMHEPPELTVDLEQEWREIEPRVVLNQETNAEFALHMTLAEAEELANGLLAAVRTGRGESAEALGGAA
jgi:hypothetical protein